MIVTFKVDEKNILIDTKKIITIVAEGNRGSTDIFDLKINGVTLFTKHSQFVENKFNELKEIIKNDET